jgi:multidrug efflux pump subunit AcrA (membrane-fusion protein)
MLKNKKYLIIATLVVAFAAAVFLYIQMKPGSGKTFKVKRGNLETVITCKGEIKGEKYTEINLPEVICDQELRIYQLKIADLIQEGKAVKKGDYIAKLDESQIMTMMRNQMQDKERYDADLRNVVIDSTVNLSNKREAINNAKLDLEYQKIDLEQSKYESEAYQRKTKMSFQKAEMQIEKIRRDYLLEKNRLKIQVGRIQASVTRLQKQIERYQKAMAATTITTPEDGIVMFAKDYSGKTYGKDSELNIWQPLIATLPDMSVVISEIYIKEIDISKVKLNDSVRITIDAIPDKVFTGKVIKIATMGEDHKDFDMKAFKVLVKFERSDKDLKPGMSANNDIIVGNYKDKLLISRKAIFSKNGKRIVYLKTGSSINEQEIKLLAENDEYGAVENTLKEGDIVLLYQPDEFKAVVEKVASIE